MAGSGYVGEMSEVKLSSRVSVERLDGALGAVVQGLRVSDYTDDELRELADSLIPWWDDRLVLFFPGVHFSPTDQSRLAHCFGSHVAATTETASDNRNIPCRSPRPACVTATSRT
ncbi:MAG: hypothetical protein EBY88_01965 [Actinobacteria bacterium]|nr:hypothetical protein [Actinomycetota bacterium]